ncbi:MAG: MBL fold metallo-hydrolase [Bacteroidota bacterium]
MIVVERSSFQEVECFRLGYHPFIKPKLCTHSYWVDGLLIDTGQNRVKNTFLSLLESESIEQVYITHHHEDHTGNLASILKQKSCPAYASKACSELMKAPPPISFAQYFAWGNRPPFSDLIPKEDFIETDQYRFDIIPTPGHAPDMVVLHEPKQGWLFSADLYLNSYISYYLFSESMLEQIQSIKRVLELDFEILFCGHNPQLKNGKAALAKKLDFLIDFYEQVEFWHGKGYAPKVIFKAMKLKENRTIQLMSHGWLSKINMVKSAVRDIEELEGEGV